MVWFLKWTNTWSVAQYLTWTSFALILLATKVNDDDVYGMIIIEPTSIILKQHGALVFLENLLSINLYPRSNRKYIIHVTFGITLYIPTRSTYVDILLFNLCLINGDYVYTFPSNITVLMCILISWCNSIDPHSHHFMICI